MAGRFQRLNDSEDIVGSPEISYPSNYTNSSLYDEPQNLDSTRDAVPRASDQPHRASTTRKPVPTASSLPYQPERELSSPRPYQAQPQYQSSTYPQAQYQPYQQYQQHYQPLNGQQQQHQHQQSAHARGQSLSSPPDQPLMEPYFNQPRPNNMPYMGHAQNPFSDPISNRSSKNASKTSIISRTTSALWNKSRGTHVSHTAAPLWAAPWRHQIVADAGDPKGTVRHFDRIKQRNRIFFHFFLQWLVPVAFCGALVAVLYVYSSKDKLSRRERYMFNALMVGFSLCLGFAVVNGMKGYASILRWRLLARRYRSLQEFELLLGLASQKKALRLMWVGRTEGSILPNGTQLLCFCYLLLMFGLQLLIALLGLCYGLDTAIFEYNIVPKSNVSIANLKYFQQADIVNNNVDEFQLQSGGINAYGVTGQSYGVVYQNSTSSTASDNLVGYPLYTDNSTMWWYWFTDQCPDPRCTTAYVTDRWITSQARCYKYTVTSGGYYNSRNVSYLNNLGNKGYFTYLGSETSATTTWYANTESTCGDRCTSLYVLNVGWTNSRTGENWKPQVFQCNNTISTIGNTANLTDSTEYSMPDEQARLVAGAIGYNGGTWSNQNISYQAKTYDTGSLWSWTRLNGAPMSATDVANSIMHFSMGAVAAIDFGGPRRFVTGDSPVPAQNVQVEWQWAILVLVLVPGIQFLVLLVAVVWGNHAIIRDDSFLAAASLLRPIVDRLERTGCALTSDEICEVLGNPSVAYGVRMQHGSGSYGGGGGGGGGMMKGNEEVMHLDVVLEEEDSRIADMGWRVGSKMPQGRYDGLLKKEQ